MPLLGFFWLPVNRANQSTRSLCVFKIIIIFRALLACGIVNTGVKNDCDPALALLSDYVDHASSIMTIGAIFGLGLAYAGSNRSDLVELLLPVFSGKHSYLNHLSGIQTLDTFK